MLLVMPQQSEPKTPKLTESWADRRISRHISECLAAINRHKSANKSLARLASTGCDIAALWLVLESYLISQNTSDLKQGRRAAAETRVGLQGIVKQLRGALTKTISMDVPHYASNLGVALADLNAQLTTWISYIEMKIDVAGQLENARGRLRPELLLVCAVMHLRSRTGRPFYREIADILEVLHLARGRSVDVDPENLRRAYERYRTPKDDIELALYERNIRRNGQHDLAPLLRRELFAKLREPIFSPDSKPK